MPWNGQNADDPAKLAGSYENTRADTKRNQGAYGKRAFGRNENRIFTLPPQRRNMLWPSVDADYREYVMTEADFWNVDPDLPIVKSEIKKQLNWLIPVWHCLIRISAGYAKNFPFHFRFSKMKREIIIPNLMQRNNLKAPLRCKGESVTARFFLFTVIEILIIVIHSK